MKTNHSTIAKNYFRQGYNCSQAILLTYCKEFGIDETTAIKFSSSFGGGMGRLREVCGAVSMMFGVLGLKYGYSDVSCDKTKAKHYELIQKAAQKFKNTHNSIICRELLNLDEKNSSFIPEKRTEEYYKNRPCENFIQTACEIIDMM